MRRLLCWLTETVVGVLDLSIGDCVLTPEMALPQVCPDSCCWVIAPSGEGHGGSVGGPGPTNSPATGCFRGQRPPPNLPAMADREGWPPALLLPFHGQRRWLTALGRWRRRCSLAVHPPASVRTHVRMLGARADALPGAWVAANITDRPGHCRGQIRATDHNGLCSLAQRRRRYPEPGRREEPSGDSLLRVVTSLDSRSENSPQVSGAGS
jgi:hypothetical protein